MRGELLDHPLVPADALLLLHLKVAYELGFDDALVVL